MTDSELATTTDPDAAYLAVASDIMQILGLKKDIVNRLETAIRRKGGDPLNLRASLNEVGAAPAVAASGSKRRMPEPRVYEVPLCQAVFDFGRSLDGRTFVGRDIEDALEPKGYRRASISPAISKLCKAGLFEYVGRSRPQVFRLSQEGKVITIKPGEHLTEDQLRRLGELRGKAA